MSKRIFPFLLMVGMLLPMLTTRVAGQAGLELGADIPFKFTVCEKQLPSGKYKVSPISSANPRLLLVKGEDGSSVEIVCTQDLQSDKIATKGKLIFNRYGDEYFLSEMWFAGQKTGNQLVKTEAEKALIGSRKKREKVTVTVTEIKP